MITRLDARLTRIDCDGKPLTDYGRFPWTDFINVVLGDGTTPASGPRFLDWRLHAVVHGDRIVVGAANAPALVMLSRTGDTVATMIIPGVRRPVTEQLRDAIRARAESEHAAPGVTDDERFADSLPWFGAVIIDQQRRPWVIDSWSEWHFADSVTFFAGDGTLLGRVALPRNWRPLAIGDSVAAGVRITDGGAPVIEGYRMAWRH
ncbi:MAG TPA: hypothetical protein PLL69_02625 [Gemmatimonadales bacterium]|nr:hypothetical protein [Gemmatimonadales bacterium]